jgi:hypothetical protein
VIAALAGYLLAVVTLAVSGIRLLRGLFEKPRTG